MRKIDVNADLGEGYGPYRITDDAALLPLVTSVNIAGGGHAGDPMVMAETVQGAIKVKARFGCHIGYPDRQGFGRRPMGLTHRELEMEVISQLGALRAIAVHHGGELTHANFHGALGNLSFADADVARTLIGALKAFDPDLHFIGLPDTEASRAAERQGLRLVRSFLADRGYSGPGRLAARGTEGAVLHDPALVQARVSAVLREERLTTLTGEEIPMPVDSILVHSDTPRALELAHAIRAGIEEAGCRISAYPAHQ
ncbi:LamB/YcsF family protein [Roseovarius sp. SYSU LYC5161]|uniref:LamB/YcsF family protein n=1 Tax=Roseovarius halophilus (ex Wu et al. 2025) TaxID=3376060 RepID=UPI00399A84AB